MTENEAYEQVAAEVAAGKLEPGLWARAFSDAMGLQDQARALYIKLRVQDLLAENRAREEGHRAARRSLREAAEARNDRKVGFVAMAIIVLGAIVVAAILRGS